MIEWITLAVAAHTVVLSAGLNLVVKRSSCFCRYRSTRNHKQFFCL